MSSPVFQSGVPFDHERIGAAAVYCSDGRYGDQFDEFLHQHLGLPRYDRVAVPGGPGCLAGHFAAYRDEEVLLAQLDFLISSHKLEHLVLVSHEQCGFYLKRLQAEAKQVRAMQEADMRKAAERIWGMSPGMVVSAFLAVRHEGLVRFERVELTGSG